VNANGGTLPDADIKIADFWMTVYLPHIERNTKASTIHGYKKSGEGHLSAAFAGLSLTDYETHQATRFLAALADRGLGVRTICPRPFSREWNVPSRSPAQPNPNRSVA
jgi:hypothetical protein